MDEKKPVSKIISTIWSLLLPAASQLSTTGLLQFATLLALTLASPKTPAALSMELPEAIRFYKTPDSKFPSGQASLFELEKYAVSAQTQADYRGQWNSRSYNLSSQQIVKENQLLSLAQTTRMTLARKDPHTSSKVVMPISQGKNIRILESKQFWTLVEFEKKIGWVTSSDIQSLSEDPGYAINFIDSFLRKKPSYESEPLTTIPRTTTFKNFKIQNNWLEVEYKNKTGFVDLNHVYLRADFAKWAHHKTMGWLRVKNREGNFVRTEDKILIPLAEITGYIGDNHRAFMLESIENGPQIRSLVQLLSIEGQQWKSSAIEGHGIVWWKRNNPGDKSVTDTPAKADVVKISTTQILEKDIFSYSFIDSKSFKGLISANGVYKSKDGLEWEKIQTFGNSNEPVAIIPGKGWFVGAYRSLDEGKSFEPYIRWDRLTETIENRFARAPMFLKILKIETNKNNKLQIILDAGFKRISLQSTSDQTDWVVLK